MNVKSALYRREEVVKANKRIDLAMELMILRCGIGCLVNDIDMSEDDYVRLYLAMFRLGKNNG